ncbi:hypothetical protein GCM10010842_34730 [Deinococcus daejeonensis]|jgi:hypothetical protein|uniref:Uncharacterized protein n=1 Tax=Deinococcus daejeonensis TaxID=1007098 RepID=A0ABQ2JI41_9DEIO|nr:hypothetical protein GCM10010842_34730 [Deinococcus daejeonensis]
MMSPKIADGGVADSEKYGTGVLTQPVDQWHPTDRGRARMNGLLEADEVRLERRVI